MLFMETFGYMQDCREERRTPGENAKKRGLKGKQLREPPITRSIPDP